MTMTREPTAATILAGRGQERPKANIFECRACGSALSEERALAAAERRYCSTRCQQWSETGNPSHAARSRFDPFAVANWRVIAGPDPGHLPKTSMQQGKDGFFIHCAACGIEFDSKGLKFCSACLKLPAEERNAMKPSFIGRMCQAPPCENPLRGKRADARYCCSLCAERARYSRVSLGGNGGAAFGDGPPISQA